MELSKKAKNAALALLPAAEGTGTGDAEGVVVKRQGGAAGSGAGAGVGVGGDDFVTSPAKPGKNAKRPVRGGEWGREKRGAILGLCCCALGFPLVGVGVGVVFFFVFLIFVADVCDGHGGAVGS